VLETLKKRWFLVALVLACVLGYLARGLGGSFPRHWPLVVLFFIMLCVGLTAELSALLRAFLSWKACALSLGMTYVAAPLAACLIGDLFFVHRTELLARLGLFGNRGDLFAGCVLVGCTASTLSSAIVYTRMSGGNHALSIVLANLSSIVSVFLTPVMLGAVLGAKVGVDVVGMIGKLAIAVLIPIVLAQVISGLLKEKVAPFRPVASKLSQIGIVIVVFTTICKTFYQADQQTGREFYEQLPKVGLQMVIFSFAIYTFLIRISYRTARLTGLSPSDSIAVGYASSQKTLPATVVLAEQFFTATAALPMILYHLLQLLYGGYDGDRLKRLAAREAEMEAGSGT